MPSVVEMLCQIKVLGTWLSQVNNGTLIQVICFYYAAYHKLEPFLIPRKWDRIYKAKTIIKRKFPKKIMKPRLFFHLVEKYKMFNPFQEEIDNEKYFEIICRWRDNEMKEFLKENPFIQRRHKKVWKLKHLLLR